MTPSNCLSRLFIRKKPEFIEHVILPIDEQISAWRTTSKKMKWDIGEKEFNGLGSPSPLTDSDLEQGFVGIALFYGFGDDGAGHADSVLSGKKAWDYACKRLKNKVGRVRILILINLILSGCGPGPLQDQKGSILEKFKQERDFKE